MSLIILKDSKLNAIWISIEAQAVFLRENKLHILLLWVCEGKELKGNTRKYFEDLARQGNGYA